MAPPAGRPVFSALPLASGGAAVLEVSAVRTVANPDAQAAAQRADQQTQGQAQGEVLAYAAELRRTADVRKNPKAFE